MPAPDTAAAPARRPGRATAWSEWLAFPIILGGAMALAFALVPAIGVVPALVLANLAAVPAIVFAELRWPHHPAWNRSHGDVRTDVLHVLVSGIGTTQLVRLLVDVSVAALAIRLADATGYALWPTGWPIAAQLALALLVAELVQYWLHRWQHEREALWRFHAVHHSAPRLYWLNAARFHPVDIGLLYACGYVPLVLLGCPPVVIGLFALFDAVFGMLQHCNIAMRLGPLNWIFSAAEPHRWHHSRTITEANTNYGSNLIVWDLVFGTFFLPRDRQPPLAIGIAAMPDFPGGYLAQLAVAAALGTSEARRIAGRAAGGDSMSLAMSRREREAFLAETHVAVISVAEAGRGPLTLPIWYGYEPGGAVRFVTGRDSRKAALMRAAGRISLCVQTETPPYRYVSVEGPLVISDRLDFERDVRQTAVRYLGAEMGEMYLAVTAEERERVPSVLVTLTPERWLSVDYGKMG